VSPGYLIFGKSLAGYPFPGFGLPPVFQGTRKRASTRPPSSISMFYGTHSPYRGLVLGPFSFLDQGRVLPVGSHDREAAVIVPYRISQILPSRRVALFPPTYCFCFRPNESFLIFPPRLSRIAAGHGVFCFTRSTTPSSSHDCFFPFSFFELCPVCCPFLITVLESR